MKVKYNNQNVTDSFPTGEGEATSPENMRALYALVRSWGM